MVVVVVVAVRGRSKLRIRTVVGWNSRTDISASLLCVYVYVSVLMTVRDI